MILIPSSAVGRDDGDRALRIRDFTKTKDSVVAPRAQLLFSAGSRSQHSACTPLNSRAMRTYGERSSTLLRSSVAPFFGLSEHEDKAHAPAATSLGARAFLASGHCQPQLILVLNGLIGGNAASPHKRRGRGI
jgi:hypothetical protein